MKRNTMLAAAAVLALGTAAMATDASAQGRDRGMRGSTGMSTHFSGNAGVNRGASLNRGATLSRGYARTGYARTGYARTGYTRTSLSGTTWRHQRRFVGSSVGIGFGLGGYGYDDWGPDYGYAPGYAAAGYGGCGCGGPAYGYWGGPAIGIGFGFGGVGFGGHRFHHHW